METKAILKLLTIGVLVATVRTQYSGGRLGTSYSSLPATITDCYVAPNFYPSERLQSSLDNLIYIVEKIESSLMSRNIAANASYLAAALLRRYQVNGVIDVVSLSNTVAKSIDDNEADKQAIVFQFLPNVTTDIGDSVLTQKEKCALHFMLSTSTNITKYNPDDPYRQYYRRQKRAVPWGTTDPSLWYLPRENGVVFTGKFGTISGGAVLAGIAASSNLRTYKVQDVIVNPNDQDVQPYLNMNVDPLMMTTIAGEIGQSALLYASPPNAHAVFGPDGTWNGTNCATTFTLTTNETTFASVAELIGATDGYIIGNYLRTNFYQLGQYSAPYLSQVLRGYYGRGLQFNAISGCDRTSQINNAMSQLQSNAASFAVVYKSKGARIPGTSVDYNMISNIMSAAVGNFSTTYLQGNTKFSCEQTIPVLPCQTENDIIIVMDTSVIASQDNFQEQKNFIGALISRIGVYPNASRVGIMTFGTTKEPIPWTETASGADIRCRLQWTNIYYSTTDVTQTIRAVQDRFRSMKNVLNAGNVAKLPGKAVIFIYLQSTNFGSDVDQALRDFRTEHPDVTTLAVGSNKNVISKFVKNADSDTFTSTGQQISTTVDAVIRRLCTVPRTLEYRNCRNPNTEEEKLLVGTDVVYQDSYQWIALSDWTFNRSDDINFTFETLHGGATFCVSRTIAYAPFSTNCKDVTAQNAAQTYTLDPCKYDDCNKWIYISVKGKSGGQSDLCTELDCESPTQVKVKITHEGVRCSGSQMYLAFPLVLMCLAFSRFYQLMNE